MTGNKSTRERFGAVFFALIMVTSMVAIGGAAFAGSASAQSNATTVTAQDVTLNNQAPTDVSGSSLSPAESTAGAGTPGATPGSTITSQGNASQQTGAPGGVTANSYTSGDEDASDDFFGNLSLDVDQDGNVESVDYQLADSNTDGTFDQLFIDENNDDSLDDQTAIGGTSAGAFTISGVTFDLDIVGTPSAGDSTDDVTITVSTGNVLGGVH